MPRKSDNSGSRLSIPLTGTKSLLFSTKNLFAATVLFCALLTGAFCSFSAMTSGDLAIIGGVVGSGGGNSSSEAAGGFGLYSVAGQAVSGGTSTSENAGYSLSGGNIYTLTEVPITPTGAPTMEWVKINNVPFVSGKIISPHSSVAVRLSDDQGVATIELYVDSSPTPVCFTPDLQDPTFSTFEGTWNGDLAINHAGTHHLRFYAEDGVGTGTNYYMTAKILGGTVQVVGRAYNYPNPFKPMSGGTTNIQYTLSIDATITLIIYDITGHEVKRMKFSSGTAGGRGGTNQVSWDGGSLGGGVAGNGMYVYKIISGNEVIGSGKLVILD